MSDVQKRWDIFLLQRHERALDGMESTLETMEEQAKDGKIPHKCDYDLAEAITHLENVREIIEAEIQKREGKD